MQYPKINGVFNRDRQTNKFMPWEYSQLEFEDLMDVQWVATEKVDGTNIRIYVAEDKTITIRGRTDKAQLNPDLLDHITQLDFNGCEGLTLYGEGYGGKIQAGAGYGPTEQFILFDALTPNHRWLDYGELWLMHERTGIDIVENVGYTTLREWILQFQRHDFPLSALRTGEAEGVVLTPRYGYRDKYGHRIMTKLKVKDFDE